MISKVTQGHWEVSRFVEQYHFLLLTCSNKVSVLLPGFSPNVMKNRLQAYTNIILSLKESLMCPSFCCKDDVIINWRLAGTCVTFATPRCIYQVSNKQNVCSWLSRPWTDAIFLSFDTLLLAILFRNLARLLLLNILCWNSSSSRWKRNPGRWLSPGGAICVIKLMNIELESTDVFTTKRCWRVLKSCNLIASRVLKIWLVKRRSPIFWANLKSLTFNRPSVSYFCNNFVNCTVYLFY